MELNKIKDIKRKDTQHTCNDRKQSSVGYMPTYDGGVARVEVTMDEHGHVSINTKRMK